MKTQVKPVTLLVTPEQYKLFQEAQARLNASTGVRVSMSQTIIRAALREIKRDK